MFCQAQVVSEKWPAIVEAVATTALVAVATVQWVAMRKNNETLAEQSKLERDRWLRDDEIRAEQNKPKAEFWFEKNGDIYELNCANLGSVAFFVWRLGILPVVSNEKHWHANPDPEWVEIKEFFSIGLKSRAKISKANLEFPFMLFQQPLGRNFEFILELSNPQGECVRIRRPFNKWSHPEKGMVIGTGFVDFVVSKCPKCNASCDSILVGDLKSSEEIQVRLDCIHEEYRQTCPTHKTTCKRTLSA